MRRLRRAVLATVAGVLPCFVSSAASIAQETGSVALFQHGDSNFIDSFASNKPTTPSWLNEPIDPWLNDEATQKSDKDLTANERIRQLEDKLKKLDSSWSKFDDGEKKKKEDAAKKPTFKIGGRIHMDYWDYLEQSPGIGFFEHPTPGPGFGNDPDDTFAFRRIRLEIQGDVPDNMLYRVQVDFNNPSTPEMKDVYMGFKELPGNQTLLIGNQKRPLGLDHLNSSRFNVFVERPLVVETFNSDARRPGICMYGQTDDESLIWAYGAYYLENVSTDARYVGDARQMSINGRLAGSPWYDESTNGAGYFHWGIAGMIAKPDGDATAADGHSNESRFTTRAETRSQSRWYDTGAIAGAEWFQTVGLEAILNVGPTQLVGEYQHTFLQRAGGSDVQFNGAYAYWSYFLTGEHIPYNRASGTLDRVQPYENFFLVDRRSGGQGTGWGAWNVAARYSYLDLTSQEIQGGIGHAGTVALNWHWNAYAKLQFDLTYGHLTDHANVGGYTGGDYTLCGTRFAIDF
ncbi:MAG: porin [Planctomycetota bacterium]|nr:porin [Planctomycetota bacterium]